MSVAGLVLAAGHGSRLKKGTKALVESDEGVFIDLITASLRQANISPIYVVLGYEREKVEEHLRSSNSDVKIVVQEELLGTGHAVWCALKQMEQCDHVVVCLVDVPLVTPASLEKLIKYAQKRDLSACFASMLVFEKNYYGRVVRDSFTNSVTSIVEFKHCDSKQLLIREVSTGVFCFKFSDLKGVFDEYGEYLLNQCREQGLEMYLPLVLDIFATKGMLFDALLFEDSDEFIGVNTEEDLIALNKALNRRRIKKHMEKGVKFFDPNLVWLSPKTELAEGVEIGTYVHIWGESFIKNGVKILGYSYLKDCQIGSGSTIQHFCHLEGLVCGENCLIGPFARVRPNTTFEEEAKIGNFVEVKNSYLAKNVKSNHLSYIGDASIGENTNIGAGVITCNFDGFKKHSTKIGKNCLVGANVNLVAPLELGDNIIVGAGSTVTKNVPSGSLAVERAKLRIICDGFRTYWEKKRGSG